eukprot:1082651-Rhodomonas_salina.2
MLLPELVLTAGYAATRARPSASVRAVLAAQLGVSAEQEEQAGGGGGGASRGKIEGCSEEEMKRLREMLAA